MVPIKFDNAWNLWLSNVLKQIITKPRYVRGCQDGSASDHHVGRLSTNTPPPAGRSFVADLARAHNRSG